MAYKRNPLRRRLLKSTGQEFHCGWVVMNLNIPMRTWVLSLALLNDLPIWCCSVGHRCGLDPMLLWLWYRLAAVAPIRPLAWELPHAKGAALKRQKKTKKKKIQKTIVQNQMASQVNSTKHLKKLIPFLLKLFQNLFYKACITLISKPDKANLEKKITGQYP